MNYQAAYTIYWLCSLFAAISSVYRFKKLDSSSRILAILTFCAFLNECIALAMARKSGNNLPLYTFYSLFEFTLICLYFNNIIDVFRRRNLGIYIAIAGVILGVVNLIYFQPPKQINSYFLLLEGLLIVGMSLFAFFRMLLKNESLSLYRYPHFWLISILLFFWNITFLTWGLYEYINVELKQSAWTINLTLLSAGAITYTCFAIVFLLYPKMRVS